MYIIAVMLVGALVGVSKAFADITNDKVLWNKSILSVYDSISFMGPRDLTYVRKDHSNKVIDWLLHYPLVWLTDIWHFMNALKILSIIFTFIIFYYTDDNLFLLIVSFYGMRQLFFNWFYHKILVKKK